MKKQLLRFFILVLFVGIILAYIPTGIIKSNAALDASALLKASDNDIQVGDGIKVTLNITSKENIGYFRYVLTYDKTKLQFIPSSGQDPAEGTIAERIDTSLNTKTIQRVFNFVATSVGSAAISLSEVMNISLDTENEVETEKNSITIKISDRAKSSNCNLKKIEPSIGTMEPLFSKDVLSYTVTVPALTEVCYINCTKEDSTAKLDLSGDEYLRKPGEVIRKCKVTAADGTEKTYTIKIVRPSDPVVTPEPTATPDITPTADPSASPEIPEEAYFGEISVGEDVYQVFDARAYIKSEFPNQNIKPSENFLFGNNVVNGIRCYAIGNNTQYAVYAQKNDGEKQMFIFDKADKTIMTFRGSVEQFVKSFDIIEGTFATPTPGGEVVPNPTVAPTDNNDNNREISDDYSQAIITTIVVLGVIAILVLAILVIIKIAS